MRGCIPPNGRLSESPRFSRRVSVLRGWRLWEDLVGRRDWVQGDLLRNWKGWNHQNREWRLIPKMPPMVISDDKVASCLLSAADLPPFLTHEYDKRGGWVALAQFAQNWNRHPDWRHLMICDPLPSETDLRRGASVAAVVHALCVRDGIPVPDWVLNWRHHTPIALASGIGTESPFGRSVRVRSPAVCEYHRVFFEISFRDH